MPLFFLTLKIKYLFYHCIFKLENIQLRATNRVNSTIKAKLTHEVCPYFSLRNLRFNRYLETKYLDDSVLHIKKILSHHFP
jgi:hypothetical protein